VNAAACLLRADHLAKRYEPAQGPPVEVLRDVTFTLDAGQSLAIVGPSGCGKSTLLNILGTLDRPTAGRVMLGGDDVSDLDDRAQAQLRNQRIGFVFQAHHLLPQLTVLENVLLPALAQRRAAESTDVERARELLGRVGLCERLTHRPGELSGGECQRVAVARALVNQPALLLADEPTGSLDRASAESLGELLVELNAEQQLAMVVVTHSEHLAERMQHVMPLQDGKLGDGAAR
jgi:lipoprotein-releasing system ATP-binding protein